MKARIVFIILAIFTLIGFSSANASDNSREITNMLLFKQAQPIQVVEYMYPCLFEWQVPPLCR